jgi:hypothetical protein
MAYTSIDNPELYFQVKIYTGTGSSNALTLDGDTDMQPDLVYLKRRDADAPPMFFDAIRGATKRLQTNNTDAEATGSEQLTAFGSDGFTVGTNSDANNSSATYVAWCWKESATSGFDIDSNSGTGSARTEAHSLSAVPHVIFMKSTNDTTNWAVYHHRNTSAPATDYLRLNDSRATADDAERWNDTDPTSSVFSMGTDSETNASGNNYISYLWSEKQGFSKFGGYTGNGNVDGPFIHLGFRPALFLIKSSSNAENWEIVDNKRDDSNPVNQVIIVNDSAAETTGGTGNRIYCDFLSNGVKLRGNASQANGDGLTFIYMAFAEAPFVNSNGVPCNAR